MSAESLDKQPARPHHGYIGPPARGAAPSAPTHSGGAAPFWGLMAFTFVLFIAPQSYFPALAPLRLAMLIAALAVLMFLFDRFMRHRPIFEFSRETVIVISLVAWAILTLPLSYWPGGSLGMLLDLYFKTLIVFWLLSHVIDDPPRLRLVFWCLSLMAVPLALGGLFNLLSGNFIVSGSPPRILGYDAPLTGNPNDLALTLNLLLPLTVALLLSSRRPAVRAFLLGCLCIDAIGVVATFSRAGFLTLALIVAMYLRVLYRRGRRQWAVLALVLVIAVLPLLPADYVMRLATITDIESDPSGSAQARWGDTLAALKYVALHPIIGAGVGMNTLALNEVRGETWTMIHNVYLQYAVDLGIPGLTLFLLLLTGAMKSARYAQQRAADGAVGGDLGDLATGIRISLIAFAFAALFHPVGYHFYFYYIAGLALAARHIAAVGGEKPAATAAVAAPSGVPLFDERR